MKVGLTGLVTNSMSTRTVEKRGNTTRTVIKLRDHEGNDRGTISCTQRVSAGGMKKKRLQYNFKEISAQIMRAKTAGAASQVVSRARRRIGQLLRQKKNSEFDEAEIEAALLHAEQMERVARKRKKNLEIEERAAQGIEQTKTEEMMEEEATGIGEEASASEGAENAESEEELLNGMSEEDMEQLLRELELAMKEMEKIEGSAEAFSEAMDEMAEAVSGEMEPRDLEEMKKKHRAEEQRDIVRADMKYLKALFDRLAREKAQAKAAAALSTLSSPVTVDSPVAAASSGHGTSPGGAREQGGAVAGNASAATAIGAPAASAQGGGIDLLA